MNYNFSNLNMDVMESCARMPLLPVADLPKMITNITVSSIFIERGTDSIDYISVPSYFGFNSTRNNSAAFKTTVYEDFNGNNNSSATPQFEKLRWFLQFIIGFEIYVLVLISIMFFSPKDASIYKFTKALKRTILITTGSTDLEDDKVENHADSIYSPAVISIGKELKIL